MKLATLRNGSPDGRLMMVSRDMTRMAPVANVATLQQALDRWDDVEAALTQVCDRLNAGEIADAVAFDPAELMAPLPRAWQWLDGSAFPSHGALMQKAFNLAPIETDLPLMYQGMSHRFLAGHEDVPFVSEADNIDFEAELGIITDTVTMGTPSNEAFGRIRLAVLINDWSLRAIAPVEMKTGFGWVGAKPACSMAPLAVTLDELGDAWNDGRLAATVHVAWNGERFGDVPATEMEFGFGELVAHAARTRDLCAGTIIGSGTVSSERCAELGSCCIAERRALEASEEGRPRTDFMRNGDRVRIAATVDGQDLFGAIDQRVTVQQYASAVTRVAANAT